MASTVQVLLANTTISPLSISLPRDYEEYAEYLLGPGEVQLVGSYLQPNSARNVGFRNLTPPASTLVAPVLSVVQLTDQIQLRWPSQVGAQYQPQATLDLEPMDQPVPRPVDRYRR